MWQRFKRAMRSFVGFFVSSIEDPELILEQNIRDMNDQVPKMNESIAMVRANQTLLEKENAKYKQEVNQLTAKVKAAIQAGRDDLAGQYASRLQIEKQALERNEQQLQVARAAYEKARDILQKVVERVADNAGYENELAGTLLNLGGVLVVQGHRDAAERNAPGRWP